MRVLALSIAAGLAALPAAAATPDEIDRLTGALGLPALVEIMRTEGIDYAGDLADQMFPSGGGRAWDTAVDAIYDVDAMQTMVRNVLIAELAATDAGPLLDFFTSPRGQEIVSYEITAREALMDPDIEESAKDRLARMRAEDSPDLRLIEGFVEANDLIESNVMGAMNSNYAFYLGLVEGGAYGDTMTESDILADVWAQEEGIRADTDEWVHSYLAMAYQPLAEEDLAAYVALSGTPEGRALNRALFAGFDVMYSTISRALGIAAAGILAAEDI